MGEVYLARDPQLDREVAIKILPETVASDPERMARFEREAKTLAAVNHSGIATVFGLHEQDGIQFMAMELVPGSDLSMAMELVPGSDLSELISKKALPTPKALEFALQIAEALEAAHQRGIIHRDLKPQNLMVTPDGKIKVLDFGLARLSSRKPIGGDNDSLPTITAALTLPGTIMGTPAYMSPEQVQGEDIDARCDIWSFGAVLFEMLTGNRPFGGKTVPETMYLVTQSDPDLNLLPASLPAEVRRLVRRCLVKEARNRLQSIGDARVILQEAVEGKLIPGESTTSSTKPRRRLALWALLPVVAVAAWFSKPQEKPVPIPSARFEVQLPDGERLVHYYRRGLALSPDGKNLAFVSGLKPTYFNSPAESSQIYLRPLDQLQARAIPGTKKGLQPFFSPDGQWLGFIRGGELLKVPTSGGEPSTICGCIALYGASWGPDGTIVFAGIKGGLQQVNRSGGEPVALTELDLENDEVSHRLPHFLPDGKAVLFTVLRHKTSGADWSQAQVFILSLETGERKLLVEGGADAIYVPSGHLVFAREDRLMAVHFDLKHWEIVGSEVVALEGVHRSINTGKNYLETGAAQFSISNSGVLAYASGSVFPELEREVVWVDRQGQEQPLEVELKNYLSGRVSPDGLKVLLSESYPPHDVWLFDLNRQVLSRQTFEGNQVFAIWGPGPDQFTFSSDREGPWELYVKTVNSGPGQVEKLPIRLAGESYLAGSWSPEGETLVFTGAGKEGSQDIFTYTTGGQTEPFLNSRFGEYHPEFSPDGRWLVYVSIESGSEEVYVRPYPGPGGGVQISREGGSQPLWSRDGREILFRSGQSYQDFYSVQINVEEGALKPDEPIRVLNDAPYRFSGPIRSDDVAPDGRRLLIKYSSEAALTAAFEGFLPTNIQVVQGWFRELEENWSADQ